MPRVSSQEHFNKLVNGAVAAHESGQYGKAEKNYIKALKIRPDDQQLNYLMGVLFGQQGFFAKAKTYLKKSVKLDPENAEYLSRLGLAYRELGENENARRELSKSLLISPTEATLFDLVNLLASQGLYEDACEYINNYLNENPKNIDVLFLLASMYEMMHRRPDAIDVYSRILGYEKDNTVALAKLASMTPTQSNVLRLRNHLEQVFNKNKDDYSANMMLAKIYLSEHRHKEAIGILSQLIESHPDDTEARSQRAIAYYQTGEYGAAAQDMSYARKLEPEDVGLLVKNAIIATKDAYLELIKEIQSALRRSTISISEKIQLQFYLAKFLDSSGKQDEAFEYYEKANALKRPTYEYSVDWDTTFFLNIEDVYKSQTSSGLVNENTGAKPLFIVGMPRSGTSLVEQVLASHSKVSGMGELGAFKLAIQETLGIKDIRDYPRHINSVSEEQLLAIREFYIRESIFDPSGSSYQTDKMPFNFMYIGLIRQVFPESPIIICNRQLQAIALSLYKILFKGRFEFAYDQIEIARYCNAYQGLANFWLKQYPGQIHEIRYENMVQQPETVIRSMLDYCGLEWEDQCLGFHESDRPVITASAGQVRQPIYRDAVNRWKEAEPYLGEMFLQLSNH